MKRQGILLEDLIEVFRQELSYVLKYVDLLEFVLDSIFILQKLCP